MALNSSAVSFMPWKAQGVKERGQSPAVCVCVSACLCVVGFGGWKDEGELRGMRRREELEESKAALLPEI